MMPRNSSGTRNVALSLTTAISAIMAINRPPPWQMPLTAAMTGLRLSRIAVNGSDSPAPTSGTGASLGSGSRPPRSPPGAKTSPCTGDNQSSQIRILVDPDHRLLDPVVHRTRQRVPCLRPVDDAPADHTLPLKSQSGGAEIVVHQDRLLWHLQGGSPPRVVIVIGRGRVDQGSGRQSVIASSGEIAWSPGKNRDARLISDGGKLRIKKVNSTAKRMQPARREPPQYAPRQDRPSRTYPSTSPTPISSRSSSALRNLTEVPSIPSTASLSLGSLIGQFRRDQIGGWPRRVTPASSSPDLDKRSA